MTVGFNHLYFHNVIYKLSIVENMIVSMLSDFKIITSMTNGKVSNFELNIDSS